MVDPNAIDADPSVIDADFREPDAEPNQPDAMGLADAVPNSPDAGACAQAPTIGFSDNFDNDSFDTRWTVTTTGTATALETGNRVELNLPKAPPFYIAEIETKTPGFDFSNRRLFVEVPLVLARDGLTRFRAYLDSGRQAIIEQRNGELTARYSDGLGNVNLAIVVYDAVQMRWWQFRDTGTNLVFEVSPDGENWSILGSTATPSFVNDVRIELYAAPQTNEAEPTTARFDNLNFQPGCP